MATYASLDCPSYAFPLMLLVALTNHFFTRSLQIVVLTSLFAGILSYNYANENFPFFSNKDENFAQKQNLVEPPAKACGIVEAIIPRAKGNAFVIKSKKGELTYRVRITDKGKTKNFRFEKRQSGKKQVEKIRSRNIPHLLNYQVDNFLVTENSSRKETPAEDKSPMVLRIHEKDDVENTLAINFKDVKTETHQKNTSSDSVANRSDANNAADGIEANPGDSVCYEASWYPVSPPRVPGAFDTRAWLKSQGFAAYGKFISNQVISSKWIPERSFAKFRKWIQSRFSDYLDPSETGLLLGLLAGDRSGIPEALRNDFQRSGLVHVLAISGFHVVLLAGILMTFLKATGLPHKIVRIIAVILLFLYIPVTGGSPAVRRAVLMFAVPQIGALLQRPANTLNSLGVALLFILIPNPGILWNPGFQLSVAATAGILIGTPINPLSNLPDFFKKNKLWRNFQAFAIDPTYVTLCATLATSPFLIHHFKTLSPFAWLGNIIVVPGISWGMQAGLFALISPLDFLRENFCHAAGFFLRLSSLFTRILSDSSISSITAGPFGPSILLLLGFSFVLLPTFKKNKLARLYCFTSIFLFSIVFCIQSYEKILHPQWDVTIIDVGQGDCILITTPSGKHLLVDSGPDDRIDSGKDIIIPYLHHIGVLQLDALIITHPDADHFGGANSIVKTFPVKELWISECAQSEQKKKWQKIIHNALRKDITIRNIQRGFNWKEHLFEIQAVHPKSPSSKDARCGETNAESITLRAKGLGHSALLTGDLTTSSERDILSTTAYLKSDILKLGHHGSKTSSSPQFLDSVRPRLALISSGKNNKFRHPHKQVTDRLDSLHIPYLNTANSGTIQIRFTPDTMLVQTMWK